MNLSKYSNEIKIIHLNNNNLTEMNWEEFPEGLEEIYLDNNNLTEMNWKGCPEGLKIIDQVSSIRPVYFIHSSKMYSRIP